MRVFLMAEPERAGSDGYGCGCRKCTGLNRPLSPKDVETVLTHLSPRVATLYALGKVDVRGEKCDKCGKVVAAFTDSVSSTHGALARRNVRTTTTCCSRSELRSFPMTFTVVQSI